MFVEKSKALLPITVVLFLLCCACTAWAQVVKEGDSTFLIDRRGERWDISQAVSIGFEPGGFEYGIGRYAIQPLDGSGLVAGRKFGDSGTRVIGVENGSEAHAYVVRTLTYHEIANTHLGDDPIAAAY